MLGNECDIDDAKFFKSELFYLNSIAANGYPTTIKITIVGIISKAPYFAMNPTGTQPVPEAIAVGGVADGKAKAAFEDAEITAPSAAGLPAAVAASMGTMIR